MPRKKPKSTATFEDGDEPWRCRAAAKVRSRDAGEPQRCGNEKHEGYQVCYFHGAGGGRPIKHGRYSSRLRRWRESYEASLGNGEELLDLTETLALLDIRLKRAAERSSEFDTPAFRERALSLYRSARSADNSDDAARFLTELGQLLSRGSDEDAALKELTDVVEKFARRQEKAWSIKLSAAHAINARDFNNLMAMFVDIVDEVEPKVATRILERIGTEVIGDGDSQPTLSTPRDH